MQTLLFIILAICQVALGIIPLLGKLYIETNNPNSYKITRYGIAQIIIILIGLFFTLGLYVYSEDQDDKNRTELSNQLSQRDSLHRIHLDSIQSNTIELLAKYGYKVDSSTNEVLKMVRDSSKTTTITGDDPVLKIASYIDEEQVVHQGVEIISRDEYSVKFGQTLVSLDAGSCCFDLKISTVVDDGSSHLRYSSNYKPMNIEDKLGKDRVQTSYVTIKKANFDFWYLWCRGTYGNVAESKHYKMDEVYFYNMKNKDFGTLKGETRAMVIAIITKNEK